MQIKMVISILAKIVSGTVVSSDENGHGNVG